MSTTDLTDEALRVARMHASAHVHVRPMFELFADEPLTGDSAKWPEPWPFHDLDGDDA